MTGAHGGMSRAAKKRAKKKQKKSKEQDKSSELPTEKDQSRDLSQKLPEEGNELRETTGGKKRPRADKKSHDERDQDLEDATGDHASEEVKAGDHACKPSIKKSKNKAQKGPSEEQIRPPKEVATLLDLMGYGFNALLLWNLCGDRELVVV